MSNAIEQYLVFKSDKEKKDIISFLENKELYIDDLTLESMTNVISAAKNNLNEELKELANYKSDFFKNRIYASIIKAKNEKINNLIDMYNQANSYNKTQFVNNVVTFKNITTVDNLKLEIDDFNYDIPINFQFVLYSYDGEIITKDIIPFNYSGLYSEYINLEETEEPKSVFTVSNKNNLYFYSCVYTSNGFTLGTEIKLEKNKHYSFDNEGHLVFDKNVMEYSEILIKYQPNENAYEINLYKRLYKIELIAINDKIDFNRNLKKRLVMFND